jgi:hypothetical protein
MEEQQLLGMAERALARAGLEDSVVAAGVFHPRGFHAAGLVGGLGGSLVGGAIGGGAGDAVGMAVGVPAAMDSVGELTGQPRFTVIAVSPTAIYGFEGHRDGEFEVRGLLWSVEREQAAVSVHSRISMRVFEIEDLRTGRRLAFEAERSPNFRTKFVLAALHGE